MDLELELGISSCRPYPAHYLHSSGQSQPVRSESKILFCGDVGAALLPQGEDYLFVKDFDGHIRFAEGFHRRWMGSNEAKEPVV